MGRRTIRKPLPRDFDLVLFGATGFTGRLVAEVLAAKHPGIRWAIAGRSLERLNRVREGLAAIDPALARLPILVADSRDRPSLDAIAKNTRVVCSTVGPYALYGSDLVAACADHGTDYCDLTGEAPWVRAMIDAHHDRAAYTGARIVTSCGFDSIPSDLGVLLLHDHMTRRGLQLAEVRFRITKMRGGFSGGTVASMLTMAERIGDPAVRRVLGDPYALNPSGAPRGPDHGDAAGPRKDGFSGHWTGPFVMGPFNTRVVRRSNALMDFAYGRDFRYEEAVDMGTGVGGLARAAAMSGVMGGLLAAAAFAPTRRILARLAPKPGEGPGLEQREAGGFVAVLHGVSTAGDRVRATVSARKDPGYGATSVYLAESALCLVQDDLPARGGLLTPASCMGLHLVQRLRDAGMVFQVDE